MKTNPYHQAVRDILWRLTPDPEAYEQEKAEGYKPLTHDEALAAIDQAVLTHVIDPAELEYHKLERCPVCRMYSCSCADAVFQALQSQRHIVTNKEQSHERD